jgi:predicted ATPase/class 3 adenylate cyclase
MSTRACTSLASLDAHGEFKLINPDGLLAEPGEDRRAAPGGAIAIADASARPVPFRFWSRAVHHPVVRDLPSGTVTFLFTDVEASTRLLHELGAEGYAEVLAEHRRALRETFVAHGGVEVDTQGDAFFVAFPTAPGALAAAAEAVEALGRGPIQVRTGLHTGTPHLTDEGYVGVDVHRAARIAAAGHGGQVLVSAVTRALVDGELKDLGEHRLKDLSAPERIYQLGDREFPPLKSLYRTNLPVPATRFVGRERELAEVLDLLEAGDLRLVTLTGPGGSGKTRLALQAAGAAADAHPDGVFWVPLAPLRDPQLVLEAAARALGADGSLSEHVANRSVLLLLDNFEHVVEAATDLSELLGTCPNIRVLVTSRELLRIPGEQAYPVPPLEQRESRELFVARARAGDPAFEPTPAIDELCAKLDNLPLALELAAGRARLLSPEQLLERLSKRLDLLKAGRGVDPRQQTLRATIEWSHDLLDAEEQRLFARLAVFAGGCTLEAAEAVCDADFDTLQSLVDKSLVPVRDGNRFWMLETIREYAAEHLDHSPAAYEIRRRHAEYYLTVADAANLSLEALDRGPQRHELVAEEQYNLRTAIDWATEFDVELGLRLMHALENFWMTRDPGEGERRYRPLLERADNVEPLLLARAFRDYGSTWHTRGDLERRANLDQAQRAYERAHELFREAGDARGVAEMVMRFGMVANQLGDPDRAWNLLEESLESFRQLGYTIGELQVLSTLGHCEFERGNFERGWDLTEQSLTLAREAGWTWWEINLLGKLSDRSLEAGRIDDGERLAREVLAVALKIEDRISAVYGLALLAWAAAEHGDLDRAGALWAAVEAEEARGPVAGSWTRDRERYAAHAAGAPRPEVPLALPAAARYALGSR